MNREGLGSVVILHRPSSRKGGDLCLVHPYSRSGRQLRAIVVVGLVAALAALVGPATAAPTANRFDQVNVVSDLPGVAPILDPLLVNPWGLALSPTSPLWVANNGSGTATLYRGDGSATPFAKVPLEVTVTNGAPTGQVFNGTGSFVVGTPPARRTGAIYLRQPDGRHHRVEPGREPGHRAGRRAFRRCHLHGAGVAGKRPPARSCWRPTSTTRASTSSTELEPRKRRLGVHRPEPAAGLRTVQRGRVGASVYVSYAKQDADGEEESPVTATGS